MGFARVGRPGGIGVAPDGRFLVVTLPPIRPGLIRSCEKAKMAPGSNRRNHEPGTPLEAERRVSATALQTVGGKGYDGFAIALVTTDA